MSLSEQLSAQKLNSLRNAAPGFPELVERVLDGLRQQQSGAMAPTIGVAAPDFTLPDVRGEPVRLSARLSAGPVVVVFYRGGWCPYCNLALRAYQQVMPQIQALGASMLAISPQKPDASLDTAQKNALEFDVLSDVGSTVARAYGLVFTLPEELQAVYRQRDILLPRYNGDDDWTLPIPASFVVGRDGRVVLSHVDVDYRNRLEPETVIAALEALHPGH